MPTSMLEWPKDPNLNEGPVPMHADVMEPSHLGNYRLDSLLGRGGMGEVFLAWDERLERHVALKRILPDPPPDERARERFRREARAIARLSHPAIVQVFDLLEAEDGETLVMEYVEGRGLPEVVARGPMELELVLRLAFEIADGLAEAHGKGLIHRDLKPENVRVTPSGRAKILDFGLARLLWDDGKARDVRGSLTQSGALVGTVHAMSPEQASGRPVDHRSDLFALGGLIYEMLSGRAPFRGLNVLDTLRRVTSEEPEPLAELRPGLPAELVDLVTGLMEKEPARRPQNARLVADVLERLRRSPSMDGSAAEVSAGLASSPAATEATAEFVPAESANGAQADDLPTGEWPDALVEAARSSESAVETVVRTLLLTDLVDSTRMVESLGDARASEVWARHDRVARDLLASHGGLEIDKSDGFLALFERPFDAVGFALAYHRRLAELSVELGVELSARAGVHLGEVRLRHNSPEDVSRGAKALEVEGLAKPMAARLMGLAGTRQTLLSHGVFDLARRSAVDDDRWDENLQWLAHGGYLLQGVEDPVEVYEVGVVDFAPLAAPPDSEKARRTVSFSEELVLGWRPAAGQSVPRRPRWVLERRLGEGGFGEVWLTRHESGESRVFKFCFEASRLRALKREVTLFRLLKEALGHRDDIARVLDWNFETAPYFIEVEHTEGGDLTAWAEQQGGLSQVPVETRVELVAQVADALAAAHSVGVLHKDVKPENVLVTTDAQGRPRVRLTDFGVGGLIDRSVLESQGLPVLGFTQTLEDDASTAGSRRYMAPELLEGKPASVPADLYSLGVLLYQVAVGDFSRALAPGWRREVDDLLAQDIALLVDGSPERRPAGAAVVAQRLRQLEERGAEQRASEKTDQRRRLFRLAAAVGGALLVMVSGLLVQAHFARSEAQHLQGRAETAREQAEGLIGFMLGDLQDKLQAIGRLDALEGAGERALEYFESLEGADRHAETVARHAKALHQMGDVRMAQGDLEEALGLFQRSLAQTQELVAGAPEDVQAVFELGQSHFWVGNVHWRRRELESALQEFEAYLAVSQRLYEDEPKKPEWLLEVSYGYSNIGEVHLLRGNFGLALEHFRRALTSRQELVALDSARSSWRLGLAAAHLRLGYLLHDHGQSKQALSTSLDGIGILEGLVAEDPTNVKWQRQLAIGDNFLAILWLFFGEVEKALAHSQRNLSTWETLTSNDAENKEWLALLLAAQVLHSELLGFLGREEEADSLLSQVLNDSGGGVEGSEYVLHLSRAFNLSARQKIASGKPGLAVTAAKRAMELIRPIAKRTDDAMRYSQQVAEANLALGWALVASEVYAEALQAFQDAKETMLSVPMERRPVDSWLLLNAHLGLNELEQARSLAYTLLGMGFRHPAFVESCSRLGIHVSANHDRTNEGGNGNAG